MNMYEVSRRSTCNKVSALLIAFGIFLASSIVFVASAVSHKSSAMSVLDLNDRAAGELLRKMALLGDNSNPQLASAWVVVATIALGVGLEECGFPPRPANPNFLFEPALDSLNDIEVFELNRIVTSNYRNAQKDRKIQISQLFPISRQVVFLIKDANGGGWNCKKVADIWTRSELYVLNKKGG